VQKGYIDVNTSTNAETNCKAKLKIAIKALFARGDEGRKKNEGVLSVGREMIQREW